MELEGLGLPDVGYAIRLEDVSGSKTVIKVRQSQILALILLINTGNSTIRKFTSD